MRKYIFLFGLMLLTPIAAANEPDWNSRFDKALAIQSSTSRIDALKPLLETALDPFDQIKANYYIATSLTELQKYGSSIPYFETALKLSDEYDPGNLSLNRKIYESLSGALIRAGRYDEAVNVSLENVAKHDSQLSDIWVKTNTAMTHRSTSFECPHVMGKMIRVSTTNYSPIGLDLSCGYEEFIDAQNTFTLYFTYFGPGFSDDKEAHLAATGPMAKTAQKFDAAIVNSDLKLGFKSIDGFPVYETKYTYQSGAQKMMTGAWTTIVDGWVLKTRVTWDTALGEDYGRSQTRNAFEISTQNVLAHLDMCEGIMTTLEAPPSKATGLELLLRESANGPPSVKSERPSQECLLNASTQENAFIVGHNGADRVYTITGQAVDTDVFVQRNMKLKGSGNNSDTNDIFVLKTYSEANDDEPARLTVFKAYDGKPSHQQIFNDFIAIHNGSLKAAGHIAFDRDGGTTVKIDPDNFSKN